MDTTPVGVYNQSNLMTNPLATLRIMAACRPIPSMRAFLFALLAISVSGQAAKAQGTSPGLRASFNTEWRFTKGDPPDAQGKLDYSAIKDWVEASGPEFTTNTPKAKPSGEPGGGDFACARNDFDDSQWRLLNLPHDWGIEGPFKQEGSGDTGKLPWWGVGWYRKHLQIPNSDQGRRVYLDVDGAMAYATVWLNGRFMGGWPYGYASWRIDLTPGLKFGGDNVIAIRLDNPKNSSRWYPGGGIYRNVWLTKSAPVHVAHWGVYVTTTHVTPESATVKVRVQIDNDSSTDAVVNSHTELFELNADGTLGKSLTSVNLQDLKIPSSQGKPFDFSVDAQGTKLWSVQNPQRYALVTTLEQDGKVVDTSQTPFGIRTIEFTATNGFLLNGQRVPLNGVCDHHDLGALGAAINVAALRRQIQILKEMGCTAIRTSHNPPAPELLDLCDSMGMLVMDESFDCWRDGKTPNDYHLLFDDWHEKDWRAELRRDRNHPCIIIWSIGNEIPEQETARGAATAAELTGIAHEEDPTRPTSAACDHLKSGFNEFHKHLDIFGYNYKPFGYAKFREANPDQALYGSETASCISSRGEYFFPVTTNQDGGAADFQMSSYDLYAPPWATTPDLEFKGQDENPSVAGEFVWTGFDYLGEPTPYNHNSTVMLEFTEPAVKAQKQKELSELGYIKAPSRSSYFGIVDLAGLKKDRFYLYQARWRPDLPMAHILPHWSWPERAGQVTPVHVYTSGDEAELFLNGQSLGRKKKERLEYRLHWDDVVYQPGTLKVVTYKNGREWATDTVKTAGAAAKILLQADRTSISADGQDLAYLTVSVVDKDGVLVPRANNRIKFELEGPGEIAATDNGDATSFEPFQSPEKDVFNGLAIAIVRSKAGRTGTLRLSAKSDGLDSAAVGITSQ